MKSVDPEQLRLLALVESTGTLSGAAKILGISPGAATQRLAKAERDWGTTLVQRTTRGARLSPAGLVLSRYGEQIEENLTEASVAFAEHMGTARRRLRIGAFQAAALYLLPPALTALRHRDSDIDLSVTHVPSSAAIDSVVSGEQDVAVFATWDTPPPTVSGVTVTPLLRDPMVLVLPDDHPLARNKTSVSLTALRDDTWIVIRSGTPARAQFDAATARAGFRAHVRYETAGYDVTQALVATGVGVALVSRLAMAIPEGATHRQLSSPTLTREIYVVTPKERNPSELIRTFHRLLREVADEITDSWDG